MPVSCGRSLPRGDEWTYEVKRDCYRAIALKDGQRENIHSRNLNASGPAAPARFRLGSNVRGLGFCGRTQEVEAG